MQLPIKPFLKTLYFQARLKLIPGIGWCRTDVQSFKKSNQLTDIESEVVVY
jgi:hypothetical protein